MAGFFCVIAVISPRLWAAEWSARPSADARAEYNDNVQLLPGHVESTEGMVVNASVNLQRADERGHLRLTPTLRAIRYNSDSLDSNDQMLDGEWVRHGERGGWQLNAGWTRDTTLTSELELSGLIQTRKRHLERRLAPSIYYVLSPRHSVRMNADYTSVSYVDAQFTGLVNYNYISTDLSWAYQWSERIEVTSSIFGNRLDARAIDNRTDTGGVQLQLNAAFTERVDGEFSVGLRQSDDNQTGSKNSEGWLSNLHLTRKDSRGQWHMMASRTVDPSGTGVLVQHDQLDLTREQNVSQHWNMSVNAHWSANQDPRSTVINSDRRYRSGTLRLSRILSPTWRVDATYAYAWQRYAGQMDPAEQNIFMLSVNYSGMPAAE